MSRATDGKRDALVTVVAPIVTSAAEISEFTRETVRLLKREYTNYELVLVDGGFSTDETVETLSALLKELPCIRVLRLSQRSTRDVMVFAGIEAAIGDYVVVLTPASDPPRVIPDLIDILFDGHDIVFGLSKVRLRRSWIASVGARLFYWYGRKYLGLNIPPNSTYLVGLNRRSINALTRIKGRYRHFRHLTRQVGFKTSSYEYSPSVSGSRRHERGLVRSIGLAKEIVVSYSRHPLQIVARLGLIAGAANLIYAVYVVGVYILDKRVAQGWTTLSLEVSIMFFFLFLILSVICEYIGRILEETRVQPMYNVMEELVSTALVADASRRNVTH